MLSVISLFIDLILLTFAVTTLLWLVYVKVMTIKAWRDRKKRPKWQLYIMYVTYGPLVVLGLAADIIHNYTFSSIICLALPQYGAYTITARLQRYRKIKHIKLDWRQKWQIRVANFVCERLLNPFDPRHC